MAGYGWPGDEPGDQVPDCLPADRVVEYVCRRYGPDPLVVATLIFAGYRRWWEPPLVSPEEIRRGMLGGSP